MADTKLAIYDLSQGLCKQMSMALLGKQLDGIWHTGVLVYDLEIYYGSSGIIKSTPFTTNLGPPLKVENMGKTKKSLKELMNFLEQVSKDKYKPRSYNVLLNNCNSFSSDLCLWLIGKRIPEHITNLPSDVMNSPMGAMITPFLEQAGNIISNATAQRNNKTK